MANNEKCIIHFWAKTTPDGLPGISVFDHMVNVGCVARCIAESYPQLLERFQLQSSMVGALAALHDLGKISPGFQRKCKAWLEENDLVKVDRNGCWDAAMESDHGKVSHAAIQIFLTENNIDRKTAKFVSAVLGAHHGRLSPPNDRGYRPQKLISDSASQIDWDAVRMGNAKMTWHRFVVKGTSIELIDSSPSLWWLAGLTSVADWIGSDERFFLSESRTEEVDAASIARNALNTIGFLPPVLNENLSFEFLFDFPPNDMQEKALATITGPGVYVIEAPMGMGKTEAALGAAYQLMSTGKANGIYFALPTQATSNRIHLRMNDFLRRIAQEAPASRLIHGNSWLMEADYGICPAATLKQGAAQNDARTGRDWFASTKRALLAPFGVGTVDQALLGVVAAKHFFVRHFALAGKVVILDEVHSYDLYTGTLIDKLISTLEGLGCTVIVLSATLTGKRRGRMVSCFDAASDGAGLPYPLITGRKEGVSIEPVAAMPPKSLNVKVDFVAAESAIEDAIALARNGGTVLWICNTVDVAQKQYRRFAELTQGEFPVGLLHSRFPFWRREELEAEWMERFGKSGTTRCGSILVSTQIVEQSVDLDADLLITELAPTDMLLQRIGRLWRHERGPRPVDTARLCILEEEKSIDEFRIMEPKEIVKALGSKSNVYAPFVLLRSLEVWKAAQPQVTIPLQIRQLIESTYREREKEPDSWEKLFDEWFGTDSAKKMEASRNCNLWQVALEDEEGVQTRLNEMPTISLILYLSLKDQEVVFVDQSKNTLGSDQYRLATTQAIHKNIVKVPEYCFAHVEPCPAFSDYLFGKQSAGIVAESGAIEVDGLQSGIRLFYADELGLVIEK
ncbi:MAG: CRISPR-associated helicase Cas3' [Sulfuricella sp.]|nr:CRISPR-associated helicase Cas3' [Sulfuricella sp.]